MVDSVNFLLSSFPDESLASLISRYHIVSGGYSCSETVLELFGKESFNLASLSVDDVIGVLSRLGRKGREVAASLIHKNSLLPLYAAFVARNVRHFDGLVEGEELYTSKSISGEDNDVWICPGCMEEDRENFGVAYLHRSHQIPGVYSCWKHGRDILSVCQGCYKPFLRRNKMLTVHISGCQCGWSGSSSVGESFVCRTGQSFSIFSREIMLANLEPIPNRILTRAYLKAMGKRGVDHEHGLEDIHGYIFARFDSRFLERVVGGWRNPSARLILSQNNLAGASLSKKLLIGFCLFGSFENFLAAVEYEYESLSYGELKNRMKVDGREKLAEVLGGVFN